MREVVLLRHAEIEEPWQGRYVGWLDVGLSKAGEREAREIRARLGDFDALFCSPLKRAVQTLELLEIGGCVHTSDTLREMGFGPSEGKSGEEIARGGVVYESFSQWIAALGGEGCEPFLERVRRALLWIDSFPFERALVVTHAGVIAGARTLTEERELAGMIDQKVGYLEWITLARSASIPPAG